MVVGISREVSEAVDTNEIDSAAERMVIPSSTVDDAVEPVEAKTN